MRRILCIFFALFICLAFSGEALSTRFIHQDYAQDRNGNVLSGATVTVYLANTTTKVSIYSAISGGTSITGSYVTTDSAGKYKFYIDDTEFQSSQRFKTIITHTGYASQTDDYLEIIPEHDYAYWVDASEANQGIAGGGSSLKDLIDDIGTSKSAVIVLSHSGTGNTTTYTLTTSETVPSNITLEIQSGAIIDGTGTLTINGPFEVGLYQIFGSSIGVALGNLVPEAYPEWWDVDGTADEVQIGAANTALTNGAVILSKIGNYAIADDLTIDNELRIQRGSIAVIATSKTLTINGPFVAGLYQAFSGSGSVVFGSGSVKEVYPELWGPNTTPGTTDMTAEIQAAHDSFSSSGTIKLLDYAYLISSEISIGPGTILQGSSVRATIIKGTYAGNLIKMVETETHIVKGTWIKDITLDGGAAGNNGIGVYAVAQDGGIAGTETARQSGLIRLIIKNLSVGLRLVATQHFIVEHTQFTGNTKGVYATDNAQLTSFYSNDFRTNVTGVELVSSNPESVGTDIIYGNNFTRNHFEINTGSAVVIDGGSYNTFISSKFEQNEGTHVVIKKASGSNDSNGNIFINAMFIGTAGAPTAKYVDISDATGTRFIGGTFNAGNNGGINIQSSADDTVFDQSRFGSGLTIADASGSTKYINMLSGASLSGSISRWRGQIEYASVWLTSSTQSADLVALPNRGVVLGAFIDVTEAFDGDGTDYIAIGVTGTHQFYAANTDVSSTGMKSPTLASSAGYDESGRTVTAYYDNGGSEPSVGKALVVVKFVRAPDEP